LQADEAYSHSPEYLKAGEHLRWKTLRARHDSIEAAAGVKHGGEIEADRQKHSRHLKSFHHK